MLNLKELQRIRRLIDFSVESDEPEVLKIRDKITDMITLQKAWNRGKRIEVEQIHDYATGPQKCKNHTSANAKPVTNN